MTAKLSPECLEAAQRWADEAGPLSQQQEDIIAAAFRGALRSMQKSKSPPRLIRPEAATTNPGTQHLLPQALEASQSDPPTATDKSRCDRPGVADVEQAR